MKAKEFFKNIQKELLSHSETVNPKDAHLLKDIKIESLDHSLAAFKTILEINLRLRQELIDMQADFDKIMSENDLGEEDLDS